MENGLKGDKTGGREASLEAVVVIHMRNEGRPREW